MSERPGDTSTRPRVAINMIASVDGHASVDGLAQPLSSSEDHSKLYELRAASDAVLLGGRTVRAENVGRMLPDPALRSQRAERGLPEEPLACLLLRRLDLSPDTPLLDTPEARVVVLTPSEGSLPAGRAQVSYVRLAQQASGVDVAGGLRALRADHGVQTLMCEGGPTVNHQLFAAGAVDELFLTIAPAIVGGVDPLNIVSGPALDPLVRLELLEHSPAGEHLFLHYAVASA